MMKLNIPKKRWYILLVIVLLLVVLALIVVFGKQKYADRKWEQAREAYKMANYAEVVSLVGKISVPEEKKDKTILASSYIATGDNEKALVLYSDLAKEENNVDAKLMLGNIYRDQKKYKDAEEAYRAVSRVNTGYIQAYLNLAAMFRTNNQMELANEVLTEGIKYNATAMPIIEYWLQLNEDKKGSDVYKQWEERAKAIQAVLTEPVDPPVVEQINQ